MDKQQAAALKTLTKARRLLARKSGWVKGTEHVELSRYKGPNITEYSHRGFLEKSIGDAYCAHGAVRKADGPGEALALRLLKQGIRVVMGKPPTKKAPALGNDAIFRFNDAKKRTKEEVLAAFDAAIQMIDVDAKVAD